MPWSSRRRWTAGRVRHADDELVQVRPVVQPGRADPGEGRLELGGARGTARGDVAQPVRTDHGEVDRGREGQQRLVGADVARRLVAADVLLARPHRHHEGALAIHVRRHPDEPAGDLADERVGRGQDAQVWAAVLRGDPERLPLARRDVRPVGTGRGQHGQAHRLDDRHEQRTGRVRQLADRGHRLQQAEEVGLRGDDTGHWTVGLGEHPLERFEVRGAGRRPVGHQGDLVELEAPAEVGPQRPAIVRVDPAAHEHAVAAGGAAGHQRGLGRGRGAVVVRCRDDVQVDQLGHQRLVLVDALERALADLGLVRRVGGVPLAAQQQLVDGRRAPVAVDAGAQERHQVGPVASGHRGQPGRQLQLGLGRWEISRDARSAAGMSAKSWSTESRPIASSIRARSAAVCGP